MSAQGYKEHNESDKQDTTRETNKVPVTGHKEIEIYKLANNSK